MQTLGIEPGQPGEVLVSGPIVCLIVLIKHAPLSIETADIQELSKLSSSNGARKYITHV